MKDNFGLLLSGGSNGKTIKERIIDVLSKEWPFSARGLYSKLRADEGKGISYQGVHKALTQLYEDGVIAKNGAGYLLSSSWIDSLQRFSQQVSSKYAGEHALTNGQSVLCFESMITAELFLFDFMRKVHTPKDRLLTASWSHFWAPLFFANEVYATVRDIGKHLQVYSITPGKTAVDRWCHSYWKKHHLNTAIGTETTHLGDSFAYLDFVVQLFYPVEIRRRIEEMFAVDDFHDFDPDAFYEMGKDKKYNIPVVINRNAELADQIKSEMLEAYSKATGKAVLTPTKLSKVQRA